MVYDFAKHKETMSSKPDWIIHMVYGHIDANGNRVLYSEISPSLCDCHTHGLDKYGSKELQIVLLLPANVIGWILNTIGLAIKNGVKFNDGDILKNLVKDYDLKLEKNYGGDGEELLRVVIPDAKGNFPADKNCEEPYAYQILSTKDAKKQDEVKILQ